MTTIPMNPRPVAPKLRAAVARALDDLRDALGEPRGRDLAKMVDVWAAVLFDVDPDVLPQAVTETLRETQYWPKPSELRTAAFEIMRRRRVDLGPRVAEHGSDPLVCHACRTRVQFRALFVRRGLPVDATEDGKKRYKTEAVERMLCECQREREQKVLDHSPSWEEARSRWPDGRAPRAVARGVPAGMTRVADVLGGSLPGVEPTAARAPVPAGRDAPPDAWDRESDE